ncbi:MAG: hypothetical protein FJ290_00490 [Planctomycetes bacterium]|nr:hypothetical protein [Planctomycetota bacterium]
MRETIERFRDLLVARMGVLEEEIRLAEALYKERHGDYSQVTLENVAIFERQARDVHHVRSLFHSLDLEQFESIEQFREFALATLQKLYDARVMFRSGLRMLMECVRDLHC